MTKNGCRPSFCKSIDQQSSIINLKTNLILLCLQNGLGESRHIQSVNHVLFPYGRQIFFYAFFAGRCPFESIFDFVNIRRSGEKISGDQDVFDGCSRERKIDLQESGPALDLAYSHPGPGMFVGEDPVLIVISLFNKFVYGPFFPFVRHILFKTDVEFPLKGMFNRSHDLGYRHLTSQLFPYRRHPLTEAIVSLVTDFDQRGIHDVEHEGNIEIDKNAFGAEFDTRWGELVGGEILEDASFLASRSQQEDRIEFTGDYSDEDNFSAIIRDIRQGCTRIYDVVGVRVAP